MRRVLVFDDDPEICDVLDTALSQACCTVFRAGSLGEAERAIRDQPIKVALVDAPMYRFSGAAFGRAAASRGIKVLMMVAGEDATDRVEAAGLSYILKPFRMAEIVTRVDRLLRAG